MRMVMNSGGYFPPPFQGIPWIQDGPLSPTVFNVVVDSLIRYWVTVVTSTEVGAEGLGSNIQ